MTTTTAQLEKRAAQKRRAKARLLAWMRGEGHYPSNYYRPDALIHLLLDAGFLSPHTIADKTADIELAEDEDTDEE